MENKLLLLYFISLLKLSECSQNITAEGRIVGGYVLTSTTREDWIGQLLNLQDSFNLRCSATLIRKCWAVTAATCVFESVQSEIRLRFGQSSFSGTIFFSETNEIHQIYIHPDYVSSSRQQNIALLQMQPCVQFTNRIQPAVLPLSDVAVEIGSTCFVSGWGAQAESSSTISNTLREATIPVISNTQCQNWYRIDATVEIKNNEVCAGYQAGGPDFCTGDVGSPLVCDLGGTYILQGIASHGVGCGEANHPGIYTRVSNYRTWIDQTIENGAVSINRRSVHCLIFVCISSMFYLFK